MLSEKMIELGTKKSTIRTIFEFGQKRIQEVGKENVFDFSLGNPSVPAPDFIKQTIKEILDEVDPLAIHGYTVAPGAPEVRAALATSISRRFGVKVSEKNLFLTAGAAAALTITFKAMGEAGDEFLTFAPFFPEYRCFVESVGAKLVVVPARVEDFQIDFDAFLRALTPKTKAVIVNSPNNPSGVVYSLDTVRRLTEILRTKEKEYGHPIFLISDEPYREIVYDGVEVPYFAKFYANTIICYSYSKSFSLPGERIGYILVPDEIVDFPHVYGAIAGAARVLTHVNAPSLFQRVIARCADKTPDLSVYEKNGTLLYQGILKAGFSCVKPQGAFYLFPKALEPDDYAFCERAKKYDLLLVPGTDFGCPGHFRAAYCVDTGMIERSLPFFAELAKEYR